MQRGELRLSEGEQIVKRYDFLSGDSEGGVFFLEDSLIFTDQRVIRRVIEERHFSQREIRLEDVNQITCDYNTSDSIVSAGNKPLMAVFITLGALLFVLAFITFSAGSHVLALGSISVSIIFTVVGAVFGIKKKRRQDTLLRIILMQRNADVPGITIERTFADEAVANEISNEIGALLHGITREDISKTE